jgi:transposase
VLLQFSLDGGYMANGIALRADYDARQRRALARGVNDSRQVRRLLSLAAVYDGHDRAEAAAIGGMDRQTLRDWVIAFNARGPDGLCDGKRPCAPPKLNPSQQAALKEIVLAGPDRSQHGVVRFRCCDLRAITCLIWNDYIRQAMVFVFVRLIDIRLSSRTTSR